MNFFRFGNSIGRSIRTSVGKPVKAAAFTAALAAVVACSADQSGPLPKNSDAAGGTEGQPSSPEPGSLAAQASSTKEDRIDASVRAFIAKTQAHPPPYLDPARVDFEQRPEDLGRNLAPVRGLTKLLGLPAAQSTPTVYPLSADGKYYTVNVLHRNFFPPSASATFSGAVQQLGAAAPAFVLDGRDSAFSTVTSTPGDPNVTVTLTVDMGQYFSVGAVRPLYQPFGGGYPLKQRIRLATKLGPNADWQTAVEDGPVPTTDTTLSFDAKLGRFLELTMTGNGCNLLELFVYPSAQTAPAPNSESGYDLASLSSQTVNDNFSPLGSQWPVSWPAGGYYAKSLASGAIGDAIATIDLGAQYPVSKLSLGFFWSNTWAGGGIIEVGPTQTTYTTVADSGRGQVFFPWPHTLQFSVSPPLTRYIRATDYFIPGSGPSPGALWSVHAFAESAPHVGYYPLSGDGKYFSVNLARRSGSDSQLAATVLYANGAGDASNAGLQDPNNAIDGDDRAFVWATSGAQPNATATLTINLGQIQSIGAVRQIYGNPPPTSSSIRVAETPSGPWTQVLADTPLTPAPYTPSDTTASFSPISAQYVELTMRGTSSAGFVLLRELQVFPSSATDPAPNSGSHLDLTYLTGLTYTPDANIGIAGTAPIHSLDSSAFCYVKSAAQGGTADGTLTVDLGQIFQISEVALSFYGDQTWPAGGKLEVDDGAGNWILIFDTGHGAPLGSGDGSTRIPFGTMRTARYIRLTGYFDGAGSGLLRGIEVFGDNVPCTAGCAGKTCGGDGCGGVCGQLCTGAGCVLSSDCAAGLVCTGAASGSTAPSVCQPPGYPSTCTNGVRDGNETDIDCGGLCGKCATGKICESDTDCVATCGQNNGAHFGRARNLRVCWPASCNLDARVGGCGGESSPCGQNCSGVVECDARSTTNPCGPGEGCAAGLGPMFGSPSFDVCVDARCPSDDTSLCGGPNKLCGACVCKPNCSAATCANPSDGCNGICPGVCQNGQTGCHDDLECGAGFTCITNPAGPGTCRPDSCAFKVLAPPLCGHAGAVCGDECPACSASCDGRQCGPDPRCGESCGTCSGDTTCNASGQCILPKLSRVLQVPNGPNGTRSLQPLPESPTVPVGAIAGEFSVSDQGTPVYTIPIQVPPGRAGMEPALSLQYSGTRANGEMGLGWHLEGLSKITRCPGIYALDGRTGPVKNNKSDKFCIDGKRLESLSAAYGENGTEYRTLIDSFSKVFSYIDTASGIQIGTHGEIAPVPFEAQGPDYFTVWTKDGRKLTYGHTYDSTVLAHTGIRYAWLLSRVQDRAGNTMDVSYTNRAIGIPNAEAAAPNSVVLPSAITYTGHTGGWESSGNREVHFDYEERADPQLRFTQGGAPIVSAQRLSKITTFVDQKPVKNYRLQYAAGNLSQIEKIFECARGDDSSCKAPTTFSYSHTAGFAHDSIARDLGAAGQFDMNGDGRPDFMATNVVVGGVPAQPTLKAAAVISDVAISAASVAVDAYAGPYAGFAVALIWDVFKSPFFGLFAKKPTITFQHELHIATGQRGYSTFSTIPDVHGLRCGGDHPAFLLDYDQDGRDDVVSACASDGNWFFRPEEVGLYVARSRGDGTFEAFPSDNSPVASMTIGMASPARSLAGPILIDLDGDGLQDVVYCPDIYTVAVQRRLSPTSGFDSPIYLATAPPDPQQEPPTPRAAQTLCGSAPATYTSVDIDGDGTQELLVATPRRDDGFPFTPPVADAWSALRLSILNSQRTLSWQTVELPNTGQSDLGRNLQLGDFNGDGLADIFSFDNSQYTVWLNTGAGHFFSRSITRPAPPLPTSPAKFGLNRVAVLDYDSDGRDDFLEHWETPPYATSGGVFPRDRFNWALKPSGTFQFFDTDTVPSIRWLGAGNQFYPGSFTMTADVDGDGHADLLGSDQGVFYGSGDVSLNRITDGLGKVVEIRYGTNAGEGGYQPDDACAPSDTAGSAWPEKCLPRMSNLVAGHLEGTLGPYGEFVKERIYTYTYINGRMNVTGHGWLGFDRRIISASSVATGDAGSTTTIDYEPIARFTPSAQPVTDLRQPYLYPLAGLVRRVTVDQHVLTNGPELPPLQTGLYDRRTQTVNHWEVKLSSFNRPFPVATRRSVETFDRPVAGGVYAGPPADFEVNGIGINSCNDELTFDTYGNNYDVAHRCLVGDTYVLYSGVKLKITPDPITWLISNPTNVKAWDGTTAAGEREYDLGYDNGLLRTVTRAPRGHDDAWHRSTYVRDDWGNVKQVIEEARCPNGECVTPRITEITYEDDAVFPNTVTDAAGQTQITYDSRWGIPVGIVDPDGVPVQLGVDAFGRVTRHEGPNGTTIVSYVPITSPNRVTAQGSIDPKVQVKVSTVTGPDGSSAGPTATEYDSYGRAVRSISTGFGGAQVFQETVYDELGRVRAVTRPHTADLQAVPYDRYSYYDTLHRLTSIEHSDGSYRQYQYATRASVDWASHNWFGGLLCRGEDVAGCFVDVVRTIDEESRENVILSDYAGKVIRNVDGNNVASGAHAADYLYGAFGQLWKVFDNLNNVTEFWRDHYGRQTMRRDPDLGDSIYSYNGYDELHTSKDPKQQVRTYNHDSLGRLESILDSDGSLTQWVYHGGRLSDSISPSTPESPGGQRVHYAYEPPGESRNRGFLESATYTIDGVDYVLGIEHDDLGRTSVIHYPTPESSQPIVVQYGYDALSGVLSEVSEVGETPHPLWRLDGVFQGHLIKDETFGSGNSVAHTSYGYEADRRWLQHIRTSIGSGTPREIQRLDYTHKKNGLVATLDREGDDPREYVYDSINRLADEIRTPSQGEKVHAPYFYDEIGNLTGRGGKQNVYWPGLPHLLHYVGDNIYGYDANGNVNRRSGPDIPGALQKIEYTPFDLPKTVSTLNVNGSFDATGFDYSADGERVVRRDSEGTTRHFIGALYLRKFDSADTTQEERFRVFVGDRQVAEIVRADNADRTLYFHSDRLGSPETISDSNGAAYHQYFDPFGKTLETPSPELSRVGFTGQDHDNDLGLIDMKGRVYDPLAGRFMTPDPVMQAPFWSQGLNRYSYVFNDPLNNTDPSGFEANGADAAALIMGWGGVVTGLAAGGGWGLPVGAVNPVTSLFLNPIGEGSAGFTRPGTAPYVAPKGNGIGRDSPGGALTQNSPRMNELAVQEGAPLSLPAFGPKDTSRWLAQNAGGPDTGANGRSGSTLDVPAQPSTRVPDAAGIAILTELGIRWVGSALRWLRAFHTVERGTSVIGHYPEYLVKAEELGAQRFSVPSSVWEKMSEVERWGANQRFLDQAIARGDQFVLATPAAEARAGSYFARELEYIQSQGYTWNPQGTALVPP